MCLDFCARVVERDGDNVVVESDGMRRRATTLLAPDVVVGDWVRVAIGSVIERLEPAAARDINDYVTTARGAAQ
jgi:hydrogenase assembly chaperone HypC/HupF